MTQTLFLCLVVAAAAMAVELGSDIVSGQGLAAQSLRPSACFVACDGSGRCFRGCVT